MFGYIKPLRCQLRVCEDETYRAYYCGLCRALRARYGLLARCVLSYDVAFLAVLCDAFSPERPVPERRRCPAHPIARRAMFAPGAALCFAADVNVALAYHKALDDWRDERSIKGRAVSLLLGFAYRKAKRRRGDVTRAVQDCMDALHGLECAAQDSEDAVADCFATLLRRLAGQMPLVHGEKTPLLHLAYHVGRWLYLLDAWEDRAQNAQSGAYNVFLVRQGLGEAEEIQRERATFGLYASLEQASAALGLLALSQNQSILENILNLGLRAQTRRVLEGEAGGQPGDSERAAPREGCLLRERGRID